MTEQEIVLFIIKLLLSGVAAFFAILLWNKTRDAAWMSIVAGSLIGYAGLVFDLLTKLGFTIPQYRVFYDIPLLTLLFVLLPSLFFILAFIIMLIKK